MAALKTFVLLLATCAMLGAVFSQKQISGDHVSEDIHEQPIPFDEEADADDYEPKWTICDITTTPKFSCEDCHTRLKCTPIGGILISCRNPYRPHCNNGHCSHIPSDVCK